MNNIPKIFEILYITSKSKYNSEGTMALEYRVDGECTVSTWQFSHPYTEIKYRSLLLFLTLSYFKKRFFKTVDIANMKILNAFDEAAAGNLKKGND